MMAGDEKHKDSDDVYPMYVSFTDGLIWYGLSSFKLSSKLKAARSRVQVVVLDKVWILRESIRALRSPLRSPYIEKYAESGDSFDPYLEMRFGPYENDMRKTRMTVRKNNPRLQGEELTHVMGYVVSFHHQGGVRSESRCLFTQLVFDSDEGAKLAPVLPIDRLEGMHE